MARRQTAAHARNTESSRTHAVIVLHCRGGGRLVLVDCAGTEQRVDLETHTSDRMRETMDISMSWHALKEVCRFRADGKTVPPHVFRGSSLTRVLAEPLTDRDAKVAAVATISPCAKDTEHTLC